MLSLDALHFQPGFLSQISHQLRIPLTGILGMTRSLEKTPLTFEQKQYLKIISLSGERLLFFAQQLEQMTNNLFKVHAEKENVL